MSAANTTTWQSQWYAELEHWGLSTDERTHAWQLEGAMASPNGEPPLTVSYSIKGAADGRSRSASVVREDGDLRQELALTLGDDGQWLNYGEVLPALTGCVDIDLASTPATNTLIIRRLAIEVGASVEVTVAWIQVTPELRIEPQRQRYTRLDEFFYRFESGLDDGGERFTAVIEVDDIGLMVDFELELPGSADS